MNVREAILKAATFIERHPHEFAFASTTVPDYPHCGTPGCAIGWTALYARATFSEISDLLNGPGADETKFYDFMGNVAPTWMAYADECARGMRLYADKYHPAAKRDVIPASVRAIFETEVAA